jgi:hypothetical protein
MGKDEEEMRKLVIGIGMGRIKEGCSKPDVMGRKKELCTICTYLPKSVVHFPFLSPAFLLLLPTYALL